MYAKNLLRVAVRVDGGVHVAGEGRVVGLSKFHSWCKCTIPLTNINSDWMTNASSRTTCIEHAIVLRANTMSVMGLYKVGEGVPCCSRLIN